MGTLQEQTRAFEAAVEYYENIKSSEGPYKLTEGEKRAFGALHNQATYGAFRHNSGDVTKNLSIREKQDWEGLGNITKVEAMRRFGDKVEQLKITVNLAINAANVKK